MVGCISHHHPSLLGGDVVHLDLRVEDGRQHPNRGDIIHLDPGNDVLHLDPGNGIVQGNVIVLLG